LIAKAKKEIIKKNSRGLISGKINDIFISDVIAIQVAKISKKSRASCMCNNISFFIFVIDNRQIIIAILKNIILRERVPNSMNLPPPPITISNNNSVRKNLNIFFNLILHENI